MKKFFYRSILFLFIFSQVTIIYLYKIPQLTPGLDTAGFTNASDTLSNGRLSYRAGVVTGAASSSLVTIDASGNADNDTNHLFPKDVACFSGSLLNGCYSQSTYTVANIVDTTNFNFTPPSWSYCVECQRLCNRLPIGHSYNCFYFGQCRSNRW